jgi:hypothetical protein
VPPLATVMICVRVAPVSWHPSDQPIRTIGRHEYLALGVARHLNRIFRTFGAQIKPRVRDPMAALAL